MTLVHAERGKEFVELVRQAARAGARDIRIRVEDRGDDGGLVSVSSRVGGEILPWRRIDGGRAREMIEAAVALSSRPADQMVAFAMPPDVKSIHLLRLDDGHLVVRPVIARTRK